MPITTKTTVEVDGEEREVEVTLPDDALSEAGLVSADEIDSRFQSRFSEELDKRVRNATKGLVKPDELASDDDRLRELRPDLFKGDGDGIPDDRLEEHFHAWERKHLQPLQEKVETLEGENGKLRTDRVDRDVLQAFGSEDVVEDAGQRELIRDYYSRRVRYSPEHDATFLLNEDGDFVASGDGDQPYLTVAEDLALKRQDGDGKYASWFKSRSRGGGGFEGSENSDGRKFSGVAYKSDLQGETPQESRANRVAFINERGYDEWAKLPEKRPQE